MATVPERFWARVDKNGPNGCFVWTGFVHRDGYGMFVLPRKDRCDPTSRAKRAHRYSWEMANGKIPEGICVLHHCDNPRRVDSSHLFLGTHKDNSADREAKGRGANRTGSLHPQAILDEQKVRDIRANYALCRVSQRELAERFGVSRSAVACVVGRKNWTHI
jgi:hypothetical protein